MHSSEEEGNQRLQVKYVWSSAECSCQHCTGLNPGYCELLCGRVATSAVGLNDTLEMKRKSVTKVILKT